VKSTKAISRVAASLCGLCGALFGMATACEPQDIYLFEDTPPLAGAGGTSEPPVSPPGTGGDSGQPSDDAGAALGVQPACASEACDACVDQRSCSRALTPLFCHPQTGNCSLPCDPNAPAEQAGCPLAERCDTRMALCVDCVLNADCVGSAPVCDGRTGTCVECVLNSDCPAERPACDGASSECVECNSTVDCSVTGQVCLLVEQRCVQCRNDGDCSGFDDDIRCLPGEQICVECISDDDCSDPERPFCSGERECEDE
jgi:hypothetical protein